MPKSRYRAAALGGSADEVEAAFYDALHNGDIDQLMACWADEDDIVCVHPGGPRLVGAAAIRGAFEAMFAHGVIRATPERLRPSSRWAPPFTTCWSAWTCSPPRARSAPGSSPPTCT